MTSHAPVKLWRTIHSRIIGSPACLGLRGMSSQTQDGAKKIGFIGVGAMGKPMATNLLTSGLDVVISDSNKDALDYFQSKGASVVSSPAELAKTQNLSAIVSMLPSAAHVKEVYTGNKGILSVDKVEPSLFIDCSTTGPECAREISQILSKLEHKIDFIDAPVSGGVPGATSGTLTFMCGGEKAAFEKARQYLSIMGKNIVHCGSVGAGQATKLCNNLVLGITMAGLSEGLALGQKLGLNLEQLSAVFNTSSARCWSSDTYNPCPGVMQGVPSSRNYENGFMTSLMIKDIRIASEAAKNVQMGLPLGEEALGLYKTIEDDDLGQKDFGFIYRHIYKGEGHKK